MQPIADRFTALVISVSFFATVSSPCDSTSPSPSSAPLAPLPTYTPIQNPTHTPSPTQTPTPSVGSSDNPEPFRNAARVSENWEVAVVSVVADATSTVLAENGFNDPPMAASQFDGSYRLRTVGESGIVLTTFENSCGLIPDELPDPEVFTGGASLGAYVGRHRAQMPIPSRCSLILPFSVTKSVSGSRSGR